MNGEIERMIEQRDNIRQSMKQYNTQQIELYTIKSNINQNLIDKYNTINNNIILYNNQNKNNNDILLQINKKISGLFFKLQCDQNDTRNNTTNNNNNNTTTGGNNNAAYSKNMSTNTVVTKSAILSGSGGGNGTGGMSGGGGGGGVSAGSIRGDGRVSVLMSQGVNENNVIEYLGCIEQRAVDIIDCKYIVYICVRIVYVYRYMY